MTLLSVSASHRDVVSRAAATGFSAEIGSAELSPAVDDDVTILTLRGPTFPGRSAMADVFGLGYVDAAAVARAVDAVSTPGLFLDIDSPGGIASAGPLIHAAVARAQARGVVVHAHSDVLLASAAYWAVVGSDYLSAGPLADVGNVGVVASLTDTSEAHAKEGRKVHRVASGPEKGIGMPGVPVSAGDLAVVQENVDAAFAPFRAAVADGRGLTGPELNAATTGRPFVGQAAQAAGLVDIIFTRGDALAYLKGALMPKAPTEGTPALPQTALPTLAAGPSPELLAVQTENAKLKATAEVTRLALQASKRAQLFELIDTAQSESRLTPTSRKATELAAEHYLDDVPGFQALLTGFPRLAKTDMQTQAAVGDQAPADTGPSAEVTKLAAAWGVDPEDVVAADKGAS